MGMYSATKPLEWLTVRAFSSVKISPIRTAAKVEPGFAEKTPISENITRNVR
jgi:hypothetical protein